MEKVLVGTDPKESLFEEVSSEVSLVEEGAFEGSFLDIITMNSKTSPTTERTLSNLITIVEFDRTVILMTFPFLSNESDDGLSDSNFG